jgi:hypothetical protein
MRMFVERLVSIQQTTTPLFDSSLAGIYWPDWLTTMSEGLRTATTTIQIDKRVNLFL